MSMTEFKSESQRKKTGPIVINTRFVVPHYTVLESKKKRIIKMCTYIVLVVQQVSFFYTVR
jgi:hypothetical protein